MIDMIVDETEMGRWESKNNISFLCMRTDLSRGRQALTGDKMMGVGGTEQKSFRELTVFFLCTGTMGVDFKGGRNHRLQ